MSLQFAPTPPPQITTPHAAPHAKPQNRPARWLILGLLGLNLLLALGLLLRSHTPAAFADVPGMQTGGNYLVITGRNNNSLTIYALQLSNLKLMALKQDALSNKSSLAATADVAQDLDRGFPPNR